MRENKWGGRESKKAWRPEGWKARPWFIWSLESVELLGFKKWGCCEFRLSEFIGFIGFIDLSWKAGRLGGVPILQAKCGFHDDLLSKDARVDSPLGVLK